MLVLQKRKDAEQAWTLKRRHAQVLRLKRKCDHQAWIGEVTLQLFSQRSHGVQMGSRSQHRRTQQIGRGAKGGLQDRSELFQLDPVVIHVTTERSHIGRREFGDLAIHSIEVGRAVQLPATAEGQPVLRIEPHHRNLFHQVATDRLEDLRQDPRVQKKGGTTVEAKPVQLERRSSPPDSIAAFQNVTSHPAWASCRAAARPPGPAPTTTTFRVVTFLIP